MQKMPTRLRVVGGIFVFVCVVGIPSAFFDVDGIPGRAARQIATDLVTWMLLIASGLGLLFRQRWAWVTSMLVSAFMVGIGLVVIVGPGNIAFPGAAIVALCLGTIPGACLLAALLTRASLRWLRRRSGVSPASSETG